MPQVHSANGVDVDRLTETVREITQTPKLAKFTFHATNQWASGAHCKTTIKSFFQAEKENTSRTKAFVLEADEPKVLLGNDHGPNATEALLYALSSCLTATLIYHAASRNIEIEDLRVDIEGDLDLQGFLGIDETIRPGFDQIRVTFNIKANIPDEQIEQLCEIAQKYSPVCDIVTNPTPVLAKCQRIE